jgi:tape measure domain-containing protein
VPSLDEVGVRLTARDDGATRKTRELRQEVQGVARAAREVGAPEVGRGIDGLGGSFGGLSRQLGGVHSGLLSVSSSLQTFTTRGLLGLGAMSAAAVGFGLKAASGFEQSEIAFGTLLGSMELGEVMLGRLQDFNLSTPFELPGLANATQQLLLYGYAGEQAFNTVKTVSDIAASSGPRMEESLGRMTLALGQIRAKGVVQGEELRQLTEAGFPALELLTELTGRTGPELRKAMETGLDPQIAADFLSAVETGQASTFARFRGGAEAQAKTLAGVASNLKDTLQIGLAGQTQPLADTLVGNMPELQTAVTGLITATMPGLTELLSTLVEGAPGAIRLFTPVLGDLTTGMADFFAEVGPHMPEILDLMGDLLSLLPELVEIGAELIPIVGGMVDVFGEFLDLPFGHELAGALLVSLLGYRALTGVAGIITGIAGAIDVLTAAQTRNAMAPDALPRGKKPKSPLLVGAGGALLGLTGVVGAALSLNDVYDEGLGWGNGLTTVAGFTAAGAGAGLLGGPFAPVTVPAGAAIGAGAGAVTVGATEILRRVNEPSVPAGASMGAGAPRVTNNNLKVDVHNPTSDVDVTRALQAALDENQAERDLRG